MKIAPVDLTYINNGLLLDLVFHLEDEYRQQQIRKWIELGECSFFIHWLTGVPPTIYTLNAYWEEF